MRKRTMEGRERRAVFKGNLEKKREIQNELGWKVERPEWAQINAAFERDTARKRKEWESEMREGGRGREGQGARDRQRERER